MSHSNRLTASLLAGLYLFAMPSLAEVMDKERGLREVWVWAIAGAILGLVLTRFRWWLGVFSLPAAVSVPLQPVLSCHDPFIGPDILREAGSGYITQVHLALLLVVVAHALGIFLNLRAGRLRQPASTGLARP